MTDSAAAAARISARVGLGVQSFAVCLLLVAERASVKRSISADTLNVIRDYWVCAAPGPRIQGQLLAKLINKLIAIGELDLAEEICQSADLHGLLDPDALREANSYRLEQLSSRGKGVQT